MYIVHLTHWKHLDTHSCGVWTPVHITDDTTQQTCHGHIAHLRAKVFAVKKNLYITKRRLHLSGSTSHIQ